MPRVQRYGELRNDGCHFNHTNMLTKFELGQQQSCVQFTLRSDTMIQEVNNWHTVAEPQAYESSFRASKEVHETSRYPFVPTFGLPAPRTPLLPHLSLPRLRRLHTYTLRCASVANVCLPPFIGRSSIRMLNKQYRPEPRRRRNDMRRRWSLSVRSWSLSSITWRQLFTPLHHVSFT